MFIFPFSVNIIRCSNVNTGRFFRKCVNLNRTFNVHNLQRFSSSTGLNVEVNADVKFNKKYVPFEEMLRTRRLEAKKSILVQVHSEQSCGQLHEYCLRLGNVNQIIHYSLQPNMHFVIVEFAEESTTRDVLGKSTHTDNPQIIPVRSQFLWFKANDHKKKKKNSNVEPLPFVKFGNVITPSYDDISSWLLTCKDISEQMSLLYNAIYLDDFGTRLRFLTALQIENTLCGMFPFVRAVPYGSSVNGFGKIECDLDVVVNLDFQPSDVMPDNRLIFQTKTSLVNSRTQQQRYIESIADLIERYLPGCCAVKRILMARVPILKFRHEFAGLEVDVSMMNMSGVYMSELLNIFGSVDERVRPLVYTIRYWAKVVNLTNPTPGRWITNFSLTLLVLFYLQHVKIIPTLDELIKLSRTEDKRFAEDVNCTFLRDINCLLNNAPINTDSLTELLKGFFDFYALFDFDSHAISLKSGKVLPKQEYSALYIVNPLESHLNVSKNVSPEELGRMRIEICNAARFLDLEMRSTERNDSEPWGLVTLFQSSHYTKAKSVIYSTIQKKQQFNSTNRLVSVSELFSNDESVENVDNTQNVDQVVNKDTSYHGGVQRTTRKR